MEDENAKTQIIDCQTCESRVQANVLAKSAYYNDFTEIQKFTFFLKCPACESSIVGQASSRQIALDDWVMDSLVRVWPAPKKATSWKIPESIRLSIEEATRCFDAHAYNACVVMCGRALEILCKDHGIKTQLAAGLKELKQKQTIDGRLYEWGEALREARNIGAHAAESETNREDAGDVLDFTYAICEYVYVLADKYDKFMKRKIKKAS